MCVCWEVESWGMYEMWYLCLQEQQNDCQSEMEQLSWAEEMFLFAEEL